MRTLHCAGVIATTLLIMADGVATAEPLPLAHISRSVVTRDGWQLTASLKEMTINSVANFAATGFTREAFVSGEADASIDGNGSFPINDGSLIIGVQIGCQTDLRPGGEIGVGNSAIPFAPVIALKLVPRLHRQCGTGSITTQGPDRHDLHTRHGSQSRLLWRPP